MNNQIETFNNEELKLQVRTIQNEDGSISISAEDTAIGFGWCREKNGKYMLCGIELIIFVTN